MNIQRLAFADNIRTLLICQVVLVHASVTYGGEGGWYYQEANQGMVSKVILTLFNALSQSFFMSLLFLIAGYFCQRSLTKASPLGYSLGRLSRLGIPLLAYYFGLGPLTNWLASQFAGEAPAEYWQSIHSGPMWFAQALLIFTALYLLARPLLPKFQFQLQVSTRHLTGFIFVLFLLTIPARAFWPMGSGMAGMQLGSFGHYAVMFAVGLFTAKQDWQSWLAQVNVKRLNVFVLVGIFALPMGLALGFNEQTEFAPFMGGLSWQAIFYAAWESAMCVLLSLFVVSRVYRSERFQSTIWPVMGRANYAVYFIHAPILVWVSMFLQPLEMFAMGKFIVASFLTLVVSFPLAWGLTRLPIIKNIL